MRHVRRLAVPIALTALGINLVMLLVSALLWWLAAVRGSLDSVTFVSNVSMLALVYSAVSGVAASLAAMLTLFPANEDLT